MEFTVIAVVTTAFLLGGLSKGIAGMGLPTVALAVLGSALGVQGAIALMVVPAFVTNIWQALVGGPVMTLVRRFWLLLLTSVVGAWLGVAILLAADARTMRMALGVALCAYGAVSLAARPITIPPRLDRGVQPLVGAATGLISGMTGTIVMPVVPYLEALGLSKDTLVQAMGLSFALSTGALGLALASHQAYDAGQFMLSGLALIPAILGMIAGQYLRRHISPPAFRRWVFVSLLILGGHVVIKSLL